VGMGRAAELAREAVEQGEPQRIAALRDRLWAGVKDLPGVHRNTPEQASACGHLNVAFAGCEGEMLLLSLRKLAVATGSACASATMEPSYVLTGIGLDKDLAQASLRISLGRYTTEAEVDFAIEHINEVIGKLSRKSA